MDAPPTASGAAAAPALRVTSLPGLVVAFAVDVAIFVGVLVLASLLGVAAWAAIAGLGAPAGAPAAPGTAAQIGIALTGTAAAALVLYASRCPARAGEWAASWQAARRPATWGWVLLTALATLTVSSTLGWLGAQAGIVATPTNGALVDDAVRQHPWLLFGFAVVLAPMYEELAFRRVVFARFWHAGRPHLGLAVSAVCFAVLHELPGLGAANSPAATAQLWLGYGFMGAAFAWLYRRTATLWAPIAAHGLNNLAGCVALLATN